MPKKGTNKRTTPLQESARHTGKMASMTRLSSSTILVRHSEMFSEMILDIADATHPDKGTVYGWTIQPGYMEMFPWLSGLASNYEKYRFRSLSFEYISRQPATSSGSVILAIDLDPNDPLPTEDFSGRQVLLSHLGSKSGNVYTGLRMPYPYSMGPERYVRISSDPGTIEPRTADAGILLVGVYGGPSAGSRLMGDLVVHYEVELSFPQLRAVPAGMNVGSTFMQVLPEGAQTIPIRYPLSVSGVGAQRAILFGAAASLFKLDKPPTVTRYMFQYLGKRSQRVLANVLLKLNGSAAFDPEGYVSALDYEVTERGVDGASFIRNIPLDVDYVADDTELATTVNVLLRKEIEMTPDSWYDISSLNPHVETEIPLTVGSSLLHLQGLASSAVALTASGLNMVIAQTSSGPKQLCSSQPTQCVAGCALNRSKAPTS